MKCVTLNVWRYIFTSIEFWVSPASSLRLTIKAVFLILKLTAKTKKTVYVLVRTIFMNIFIINTYLCLRFIAIRYPLRARSVCTKRHASVVIVSTWLVSFILAIPVIFAIVSTK